LQNHELMRIILILRIAVYKTAIHLTHAITAIIGDKNTIQMNENFYKGKDIEKRVINVQELSSTINNKVPAKDGNFTSEDLALQLIQGAKKVSFKIKSP